jgi:hypothetical protein
MKEPVYEVSWIECMQVSLINRFFPEVRVFELLFVYYSVRNCLDVSFREVGVSMGIGYVRYALGFGVSHP